MSLVIGSGLGDTQGVYWCHPETTKVVWTMQIKGFLFRRRSTMSQRAKSIHPGRGDSFQVNLLEGTWDCSHGGLGDSWPMGSSVRASLPNSSKPEKCSMDLEQENSAQRVCCGAPSGTVPPVTILCIRSPLSSLWWLLVFFQVNEGLLSSCTLSTDNLQFWKQIYIRLTVFHF